MLDLSLIRFFGLFTDVLPTAVYIVAVAVEEPATHWTALACVAHEDSNVGTLASHFVVYTVHQSTMMKVLCSLSLLAVASAFAPQPVAFTTMTPSVADRSVLATEPVTHRTRKATIVMDGKSNGRLQTQVPLYRVDEDQQRLESVV